MKCLRCGHCCKWLWVIIIDDPEKGICENNIVEHRGQGVKCKHLRGDKPGEYWCAIHDYPWYSQTPCFRYSQIERSPDDVCRMGEYIMELAENKSGA